jgi:hypothetical protein
MYRARLGSKARAWARLERAQAWIHREPGLGSRLRLGSARLGLEPGLEEDEKLVMDFLVMIETQQSQLYDKLLTTSKHQHFNVQVVRLLDRELPDVDQRCASTSIMNLSFIDKFNLHLLAQECNVSHFLSSSDPNLYRFVV